MVKDSLSDNNLKLDFRRVPLQIDCSSNFFNGIKVISITIYFPGVITLVKSLFLGPCPPLSLRLFLRAFFGLIVFFFYVRFSHHS